ncbi:methyl-accepting chemotaxis protein [Permianibacter aggregans]|uniref:HAMP domain-containing protein n=1 Tax=Permianibacter aggregans TaxID=1510150 RepID=A0A4R6UJP1_9GAMM|nr:methyl-accepting chemotaxis protein [Permianibacter aggregans]QGX39714.1 methyl-accepting chemotaxis protein [Permianibacter aggregans]TDQ47170.1 HAMP domain-containing protein [Permianibacter aggregans]
MLIVLACGVGMRSSGRLGELANDVSGQLLPSVNPVLEADRDLYQALTAELGMVTSSGERAALEKAHLENLQQAAERIEKAADLHPDHREIQAEHKNFTRAFQQWKATSLAIINGQRDAETLSRANSEFETARDSIDRMTGLTMGVAVEADKQVNDTRATSQATQLTLMIIGLAVCLVLAVFFPRMILGPLNTLPNRLQQISHGNGDLTQRVEVHSRDELGKLAEAFDEFVAKLLQTISRIVKHSNDLSAAAGSLSGITSRTDTLIHDQHQATELVATAVNEMAATLNPFAASPNKVPTTPRPAPIPANPCSNWRRPCT